MAACAQRGRPVRNSGSARCAGPLSRQALRAGEALMMSDQVGGVVPGWPDRPSWNAAGTVRVSPHRIRSAVHGAAPLLAGVLESSSSGYVIRHEAGAVPVSVDCVQAQGLGIGAACAAVLRSEYLSPRLQGKAPGMNLPQVGCSSDTAARYPMSSTRAPGNDCPFTSTTAS